MFKRKVLLSPGLWFLAILLSGCSVVGTAKSAALQVTSAPEASVFLDGKHLGKTPFFSDQIKPGEYTIKISVSEASFSQKVSLKPSTLTVIGRDLAANFLAQAGETLTLEKGQKGLFVSSIPQGADVTVDGKLVGKTPLLSETISNGDHKVQITKDDYLSREFAIKISTNYRLLADVSLASTQAKQPQTQTSNQSQKIEVLDTPLGFLRVRSQPTIDAQEVGRVKTGDQLELIQEIPDWQKVKFEGKDGWISAQYTKRF